MFSTKYTDIRAEKLNLVTTKIKETSGPMITPKQQFLTIKKTWVKHILC